MYVLPKLRLKQPDLIERWTELAGYARQVPPRPGVIRFQSTLIPEWELGAKRSRGDASMVFFTRLNEEDMGVVENAGPGQDVRPVHTEYKVSERVPFIIRHIGVTHMVATEDGGLELASKDRLGLRGTFRLIRTAWTTDALIPSAQELDELLEYLRNATGKTE
ncbi:hypothetical protein [Streptomyces sp. 5-10]|uniref:hypothetical protein n=1 Tax=Streptomyces sp. 5-10 TaxID=878925 RepID=UPI00168AAC6B|nr:hypothetical protein [Streptomyces sp. 5-10]MBD3004811.1 hypothetical protein [Streptomyces sp. 5-10]